MFMHIDWNNIENKDYITWAWVTSSSSSIMYINTQDFIESHEIICSNFQEVC
jgi:hypothetical protein